MVSLLAFDKKMSMLYIIGEFLSRQPSEVLPAGQLAAGLVKIYKSTDYLA
jgi:hypothetical protein